MWIHLKYLLKCTMKLIETNWKKRSSGTKYKNSIYKGKIANHFYAISVAYLMILLPLDSNYKITQDNIVQNDNFDNNSTWPHNYLFLGKQRF